MQFAQDYQEVKIILRVPRNQQPTTAAHTAESVASGDSSLPETAVGVNGIELREQTHEEALLSTIGAASPRLSICVSSQDRSSIVEYALHYV